MVIDTKLIEQIKSTPWFQQQGKPDAAWCFFATKAEAGRAFRRNAVDGGMSPISRTLDLGLTNGDAAGSAAREAIVDKVGKPLWDTTLERVQKAMQETEDKSVAWRAAATTALDEARAHERIRAERAAKMSPQEQWARDGVLYAPSPVEANVRGLMASIALTVIRDATLTVLAAGCLAAENKHRIHTQARWVAWERGYGLVGDCAGVLYVYRDIVGYP